MSPFREVKKQGFGTLCITHLYYLITQHSVHIHYIYQQLQEYLITHLNKLLKSFWVLH